MLHRKKIGKPYYRFCQKKRKDNNLEYRSRKWDTTNIRILRSLRLIRCWLGYAATVSSTISQIDHPRGDAMEVATWYYNRSICDNDKIAEPLKNSVIRWEMCSMPPTTATWIQTGIEFLYIQSRRKEWNKENMPSTNQSPKSKVLGLCKRERERGKKNPYLARMRREQRGRSNGPI